MNEHKQTRKQLAKQVSQTLRPMGVYQIENKINGKKLIGSSLYLDTVWNRHLFQLQMGGQHVNKELAQDWKTYGEDAFAFEILEQIKPKDEICTNPEDMKEYKQEIAVLEELWIEKLQPYGDQGYHKVPRTK
ncbi:hypothetical protein BVG16_10460 [Paenibacillus selenitireducens]|jgi:hypothetical protein|uniref:GIY-YIG domain-containing protein n=1 Tax=Paenibacillus selenitireducens TaxID=1324314 RepID=A0A1T2XHW8_9BACL|nr:GIY-YIG nuclease family protein [Paenibacillus selenitireducens]OPA79481.1 hypothetical protein BVG16_10460 [Paenibacillus selenitireducens]